MLSPGSEPNFGSSPLFSPWSVYQVQKNFYDDSWLVIPFPIRHRWHGTCQISQLFLPPPLPNGSSLFVVPWSLRSSWVLLPTVSSWNSSDSCLTLVKYLIRDTMEKYYLTFCWYSPFRPAATVSAWNWKPQSGFTERGVNKQNKDPCTSCWVLLRLV